MLLAGSPDRKICVGHCLDVRGFGRVKSHISLLEYSVKFQDVTIAKYTFGLCQRKCLLENFDNE